MTPPQFGLKLEKALKPKSKMGSTSPQFGAGCTTIQPTKHQRDTCATSTIKGTQSQHTLNKFLVYAGGYVISSSKEHIET